MKRKKLKKTRVLESSDTSDTSEENVTQNTISINKTLKVVVNKSPPAKSKTATVKQTENMASRSSEKVTKQTNASINPKNTQTTTTKAPSASSPALLGYVKDIKNRDNIKEAMRNIYHVIHPKDAAVKLTNTGNKSSKKEGGVASESTMNKGTPTTEDSSSSSNKANATKSKASTTSTNVSSPAKSPVKRGRPKKVDSPLTEQDIRNKNKPSAKPNKRKQNDDKETMASNNNNNVDAMEVDIPVESVDLDLGAGSAGNTRTSVAKKGSNASQDSGSKETVLSVFSQIRLLQPSRFKQKDGTAASTREQDSTMSASDKHTQQSNSTSVDFSKEKRQTPSTLDLHAATSSSGKATELSGSASKQNTAKATKSKQKKADSNTSGNSGDKGRKLSLKEYQAKKHSKRSSSSTDEGLFLEFIKVPNASELVKGKTPAPVKTSSSTDNATIIPPQKTALHRQTSLDTDRMRPDQLATNPDVLGNILQTFEQPQENSSAAGRSSTSQNDTTQRTEVKDYSG